MSTLTDRIHARCIEDGDCLVWQGYSVRGKYPQIRVGDKSLSVRRVLWEEKHGCVPDGKEVAVTCETRNCVAHIKPMTHKDVGKRTAATGVYASPVRCAKIAATRRAQVSDLTPEQVADVRYGGGSLAEAAQRNGISKGAAGFIRRGERWKEYSTPFAGLGARAESSERRRA